MCEGHDRLSLLQLDKNTRVYEPNKAATAKIVKLKKYIQKGDLTSVVSNGKKWQ